MGGGREAWSAGIGEGFHRSYRPVVGTFDHFIGLSSNTLLTFSDSFDHLQLPWGREIEQKISAQFKSPTYARTPPIPRDLH